MGWRRFFRRAWWDRERREELESYLQIETDENIARGMPAKAAREAAMRKLGNPTMIRERIYDMNSIGLVDQTLHDSRYALRQLRRSKGWALVVLLSLALGIGANTALYSLIDAMFIRRLPVENPDQLVYFDWSSGPRRLSRSYSGNSSTDPETKLTVGSSFSIRTYEQFRAQSQTLSDVVAFVPRGTVNINVDGQADLVQAQLVSGNYFTGLRAPAVIGRTIAPEDDQPSASPVAVIGYRYWQRRFALDPEIIGRKAVVNNVPVTIIGVTEPGFEGTLGFASSIDISIPIVFQPQLTFLGTTEDWLGQPWVWWVSMMGRMKGGVTREQVHAELEKVFQASALDVWNAIPASLRPPVQSETRDIPKLQVHPGSRGSIDRLRDAAESLPIMAGVFGLLFLIVCVNVANLLLARNSVRQREIAIRLAVGGSRGRILWQFLIESVVLATIAGMIGVVFAYWGKDLFISFLPRESFIQFLYDLRIDIRTLAFAGAVALATGVLFGLGMGWRATRMDLNQAMKENTRSLQGSPSPLAKSLVVAQVGLSVVLLVGTGLLLRTLGNLNRVDVGFNTDRLVLFRLDPGSLQYPSARTAALFDQFLERIEALPGVLGATMSEFPLAGAAGSGSSVVTPTANVNVRRMRVRANFFDTMGIPLLSGRSFTSGDRPHAAAVAVINETLARHLFPDSNPIGRRFAFAAPGSTEMEVVGVVKDVQTTAVRQNIPPIVYLHDMQRMPGAMTVAVRTASDPMTVVPAIRETLHQIDSNVPVSDLKTQDQQVAEGFARERVLAAATTFFGAVALALVSIGLYGLLSHHVERRTNEIGIRMALGARGLQIVRTVVTETALLVMAGSGLGIIAYAALRRTVLERSLSSLMFGVDASDPWIPAAAIVVLLFVVCLAVCLPARRATQVDPMNALRYE